MGRYRSPDIWSIREDDTSRSTDFNAMLTELLTLNVRTLQVLLSDLNSKGYIYWWSGDYHKMLVHSIELSILERTVLK